MNQQHTEDRMRGALQDYGMLCHIMEFLSLPEVLSLMTISRDWYGCIMNFHWLKFSINNSKKLDHFNQDRKREYYDRIEKLCVCPMSKTLKSITFLHNMKNLTELKLEQFRIDELSAKAIGQIPLRSLSMTSCMIEGGCMKSICANKNMTEMIIDGCIGDDYMVRMDGIEQLVEMRKFTCLHSKIFPGSISGIANMKKLTHLSIGHTSHTDNLQDWLRDKYDLTHFTILNDTTEAVYQTLSQLERLTSLNVRQDRITPKKASFISKMKNLTYINLPNHGSISQFVLDFSAMSKLKNIEFRLSKLNSGTISSMFKQSSITRMCINGDWPTEFFMEGSIMKPVPKKTNNWSIAEVLQEHPLGLQNLKSLAIHNVPCGINDVKVISTLEHLTDLDIEGLNDENIEYLTRLNSLTSLCIGRSDMTSKGLECISRLENLESLSIRTSTIEEEGIDHLHKLKRLVALEVMELGLSVGVFIKVCQLRTPTRLGLAIDAATNSHVAHLATMTQLKHLYLRSSSMTNEALRYLKPLDNLEYLFFHYIEKEEAICLKEMKNLRWIKHDDFLQSVDDFFA